MIPLHFALSIAAEPESPDGGIGVGVVAGVAVGE